MFKPTDWIERNILIRGHQPNLRYRPWWDLPLNLSYVRFPDGAYRREAVYMAGRQVEKSSGLCELALAEIQTPHTSVLYVAPSNTQISEFGFRHLDPMAKESPALSRMIERDAWSGSRKGFTNGASVTLRSSFLTPDRVRGIPAEVLLIDEIQDILTDNIPVIRETLAHCERVEGPICRYSGTPKTFDNPLEYYWSQESTQNEWMVRCAHCGKWNEGMGEDNIGPRGLICRYCHEPIDPFGSIDNGRRIGAGWFRVGPENAELEGFRIPQLLLPYTFLYNTALFEQKWTELLYKQRRYHRPRFMNEVVGISYDSGEKPITRDELRAACSGQPMFRPEVDEETIARICNGYVFCGVDWGTGFPSRTVFTAGRYTENQIFEIFYIKVFEGLLTDAESALAEVFNLLKTFRARFVGLDWGFGYGLNNRVRNSFGVDKTLVYAHTDQREKLHYDPSSWVYTTNRSAVLSDIFQLIKAKQLRFRCTWEEFQRIGSATDFMNVYKTVSRVGRLVYNHAPKTTDDTLHSVCYTFLSSMVKFPRPDLAG